MNKKKVSKPYWEMTTAELREATKQFDEEFVAEKSRPLTAEERALWDEVRNKPSPAEKANRKQTVTVQIDKTLLKRCTALARKKRVSRDALIARGLKALLAVEGQD